MKKPFYDESLRQFMRKNPYEDFAFELLANLEVVRFQRSVKRFFVKLYKSIVLWKK